MISILSPNKMVKRVAIDSVREYRAPFANLSWKLSFAGQVRLDICTINAWVGPLSVLAMIILTGVLTVPNVDIFATRGPLAAANVFKWGANGTSSSAALPVGLVNSKKPAKKSEDISKWSEFHVEDDDVDEAEKLLLPIRLNGTLPCHNVRTQAAQVLGLPIEEAYKRQQEEERSIIRLEAGKVHEVLVVSIGDDGSPRCAGGDYYETDLSGPRWKSRPPVQDYNNGTYSIKLQVDPRFLGLYTFKVVLLFSNFHGLDYHPQKRARLEEVARYQIEFFIGQKKFKLSTSSLKLVQMLDYNPGVTFEAMSMSDKSNSLQKQQPVGIHSCRLKDFQRKHWSGRWTREEFNEDCEYDRDGRWKCVDTKLQCQKPWCEGPVGSLESNGWVYSAHCAFKIFQKEEAWKCLDGKWLFFWGDSNHIDTIRNLLNFVLGFNQRIESLDRRMDLTFFSPPDNRSSVRITSLFNGHANVTMNHQGLFSLHDRAFAEQLRSYFTGGVAPDVMIMNSGLHDGIYWKDTERFLKQGVEFAAAFWADVWNNMRARRPEIIYRTTVAAAGRGRSMPYNPQKMEVFNNLMVERLLKMKLKRFHVIDGFDYTFPWHWDHKASDGPHYGRPPSRTTWPGDNVGHRYFVDLMLVHMLLNAVCAAKG